MMLNAKLQPDILLIDLSMPVQIGDSNIVSSGLTAIKYIKASRPEARIVVLTMHDDAGYLREALEAGCAGYIVKRAADVELLSAIRAVFGGGTYIHSDHARLLLGRKPSSKKNPPDDHNSYDLLSPREKEVLRLIAMGYTNQQVADILSVSIKTVETYKRRLMTKLKLDGRAALVRYAIQQGLLEENM
jgi:DNA-binding NarL/FixJ family response regulator